MVLKRDKTVLFRPDGFLVSTKDFLDILKEGKIVPVAEINCVQPSNGGYLVTLKSTAAADRLSEGLQAKHRGRSFLVDSVESPKAYVKVYNLPFEISNKSIGEYFGEFGKVLKVRADRHQNTDFCNGDRTVILQTAPENLDNIPETVELEGFVGRIFCKRTKKSCRYCKADGHTKAACPDLKCNSCGVVGHFAKECPSRKCNFCLGTGHWARQCPAVIAPKPPAPPKQTKPTRTPETPPDPEENETSNIGGTRSYAAATSTPGSWSDGHNLDEYVPMDSEHYISNTSLKHAADGEGGPPPSRPRSS